MQLSPQLTDLYEILILYTKQGLILFNHKENFYISIMCINQEYTFIQNKSKHEN